MFLAVNYLVDTGLAHAERHGKERHIRFKTEGRQLFDAAHDLLRSPVRTRKFVRNGHITAPLKHDTVLTRIPVDDDVISLSAILLDDAYYTALQEAKKSVNGVTIIDEGLLIPFKARAFLDLTERLEADRNVHRDRAGPRAARAARGSPC